MNIFFNKKTAFLILLGTLYASLLAFEYATFDDFNKVCQQRQERPFTCIEGIIHPSKDPKKAPIPCPKPVLSEKEFTLCVQTYLDSFKDKNNGFTLEQNWVFNNAPKENNHLFDISTATDYYWPYAQRFIVQPQSKVFVMGDIHGSLHSVLRALETLIKEGYLNNQFKIIKNNFYMVFLGDYVDRGFYSIEVLYTLMRLKIANWKNVFLLRGNHEDTTFNIKAAQALPSIVATLREKYKNNAPKMINIVGKIYELLPHVVFMQCNDDVIQLCHGGFDPYFNPQKFMQSKKTFEKLEYTDQTLHSVWSEEKTSLRVLADLRGFNQNHFIMFSPTNFIHVGFNWFDFNFALKAKHNQLNYVDARGYGATKKVVKKFLKMYGLRAIFRGHQHMYFGLKMFSDSDAGKPEGDYWRTIVHEKQTPDGFLLKNYFPVFTFSSAVESYHILLPHDFFAIVTTAATWNEWRLKPYERPYQEKSVIPVQQPQQPSSDSLWKKFTHMFTF